MECVHSLIIISRLPWAAVGQHYQLITIMTSIWMRCVSDTPADTPDPFNAKGAKTVPELYLMERPQVSRISRSSPNFQPGINMIKQWLVVHVLSNMLLLLAFFVAFWMFYLYFFLVISGRHKASGKCCFVLGHPTYRLRNCFRVLLAGLVYIVYVAYMIYESYKFMSDYRIVRGMCTLTDYHKQITLGCCWTTLPTNYYYDVHLDEMCLRYTCWYTWPFQCQGGENCTWIILDGETPSIQNFAEFSRFSTGHKHGKTVTGCTRAK